MRNYIFALVLLSSPVAFADAGSTLDESFVVPGKRADVIRVVQQTGRAELLQGFGLLLLPAFVKQSTPTGAYIFDRTGVIARIRIDVFDYQPGYCYVRVIGTYLNNYIRFGHQLMTDIQGVIRRNVQYYTSR